jgi:hypothetical protein
LNSRYDGRDVYDVFRPIDGHHSDGEGILVGYLILREEDVVCQPIRLEGVEYLEVGVVCISYSTLRSIIKGDATGTDHEVVGEEASQFYLLCGREALTEQES